MPQEREVHETRAAYLTVEEGNILHVKIKNVVVTEADAHEIVAFTQETFEGAPHTVFVDLAEIREIEKGAREAFSGKGRDSYAEALAFLVRSSISKVIGNFFIGINKPRVPTRMFSDKAKALEWLRTKSYKSFF